MDNADKLVRLGMPDPLAKEVDRQIADGGGAGEAIIIAEEAQQTANQVKQIVGSTPEDFGALGNGIADDTDALIEWMEAGGTMTANGRYRIAFRGMDSGGAYAVLRNNVYFTAGPDCEFIAGLGLDNDMMRYTASLDVYLEKGPLEIVWNYGTFDQRLQANSTSVPFSNFYPVFRPGVSATTDGFYNILYVETSPGVYESAVSRFLAYRVKTNGGPHWQNAGGDSGIFAAGALNTEIIECEAIGARDCGFYGSGFPSGPIPNGTVIVRDNTYRGCCMGGIVKRQMGKITMTGNRGFNTAEVVGIQGLSGTGGAGSSIYGNIGVNAWHVVRNDDSTNIDTYGNISLNHGHILADGSAPTAVFNLENAVVRLSGVSESNVRGNILFSVDPIASGYTDMSVLQVNGSTANPVSLNNRASNNTAFAGKAVVLERTGAADGTLCMDNQGTAAMLNPVVLFGAASVNYDFPGIMDAVTTTGASQNTTQTLKTLTIPNWFIAKRLDRMHIIASGAFTGTAGAKSLSVTIGDTATSGVQIALPDLDASFAGNWSIDADVVSTSATAFRVIIRLNGGQPLVVSGNIAASRPWVVAVRGRTHNAADTMTQTLLLVEKTV